MRGINEHLIDDARPHARGGMTMLRDVELKPGQVLYRFGDARRPGDGPWWWEAEHFRQIEGFARRHGYSLSYSARLHGAILFAWSNVDLLVRAEVTAPIVALKGRGLQVGGPSLGARMTPMQSVNEAYQLYIPGFGREVPSAFGPALNVVHRQRLEVRSPPWKRAGDD
jgi:hypothetical protein